MRQPVRSIWESASRPLFVRSVWLERIGDTGRSHRRHFILDYEPRDRQRWMQCQRQTAKRTEITYESEHCEPHGKSTGIEESEYTLDEYLLLDATKLTLQQQQQAGQAAGAMSNKVQAAFSALQSKRNARRRAWLLGRGNQFDHLMDQNSHQSNSHSRRSSLQDAVATSTHTNNPEERLAERVINWLDLAGRADIVKSTTTTAVSSGHSATPAVHPKSQRISRQSHRSLRRSATGTTAAASHRETSRKSASKPPVINCCPNTSPNAKPITIIFNKEGVPVRLNRPPRNIDLCALSNSATVTRRMAGPLASARLYSGNSSIAAPAVENSPRTPPHSNRALTAAQQDSRKQLHIFMPSLPKKGLLLAATNNEDALSASFNDLYF